MEYGIVRHTLFLPADMRSMVYGMLHTCRHGPVPSFWRYPQRLKLPLCMYRRHGATISAIRDLHEPFWASECHSRAILRLRSLLCASQSHSAPPNPTLRLPIPLCAALRLSATPLCDASLRHPASLSVSHRSSGASIQQQIPKTRARAALCISR